MLTVALIVLGLIVGIVVLAAAVGSSYPKGHVVERSLILKVPREAVWEVVSNFRDQPTWRPSLKSVERLPGDEEVWREVEGKETIDLKTKRIEPPRTIVREVVGDNLPFKGIWEFSLEAGGDAGGSRLTLTERGEVPNPIFRLIAATFMDPAANLERYLKDLAARFTEPTSE